MAEASFIGQGERDATGEVNENPAVGKSELDKKESPPMDFVDTVFYGQHETETSKMAALHETMLCCLLVQLPFVAWRCALAIENDCKSAGETGSRGQSGVVPSVSGRGGGLAGCHKSSYPGQGYLEEQLRGKVSCVVASGAIRDLNFSRKPAQVSISSLWKEVGDLWNSIDEILKQARDAQGTLEPWGLSVSKGPGKELDFLDKVTCLWKHLRMVLETLTVLLQHAPALTTLDRAHRVATANRFVCRFCVEGAPCLVGLKATCAGSKAPTSYFKLLRMTCDCYPRLLKGKPGTQPTTTTCGNDQVNRSPTAQACLELPHGPVHPPVPGPFSLAGETSGTVLSLSPACAPDERSDKSDLRGGETAIETSTSTSNSTTHPRVTCTTCSKNKQFEYLCLSRSELWGNR